MYLACSTASLLFLFFIAKYKTVVTKVNVANNISVIIGLTKSNPASNTIKSAKSAISATDVASTETVIRSTPVVREYISF
jgi:hypothetical protein